MVEESTAIFTRAAERADACTLAALRAESLVEMGLLERPARARFVAEASRRFDDLFAEGRLAAWILVDGACAVGCACVVFWDRLPYPDGAVHAEIAGVYVAPGYRRRGFATALTRNAIAAARARDSRKIVLSPTAAARPLYERLGFGAAHQMQLRR
ncbi:MAG TPA: GNAT family N-acetyltransferase [Candidatus Binatia bacterium]|nr:GNAT family N-acetyltransferase [Candidatus Binatia bacterium]